MPSLPPPRPSETLPPDSSEEWLTTPCPVCGHATLGGAFCVDHELEKEHPPDHLGGVPRRTPDRTPPVGTGGGLVLR